MDPSFFFVVGAMFLILYLLMIRPQRQQQRRHAAMIESLKPGDEVITSGGIYGDVTSVEDDRVTLEIAEDVEIEVVKRAIASDVLREQYAEEPEAAESEAADEVEPAVDAVAAREEEEAPAEPRR